MSDAIDFAKSIDTSGLLCPLPILKAKKALNELQSGEVLKVITTDKHAKGDFEAFCTQTKNPLIAQVEIDAEHMAHFVQRR
ncbi:sulfurtransferase TusA family protein [Brackiella oedipodis]|uniref:sulfurtransferase TusA family protein n=1 Tax=Brackiella oedipodis TaxID=124225 RepID=UPI00048F546C|nr:sulfurtransferase TusA family protein [Brackiella oedipodis]